METILEVRMEEASNHRAHAKASIHLSFGGGGFTVSTILIYYDAPNKFKVAFPRMQIGNMQRPVLTLDGDVKKAVHFMLEQAFVEMKTEKLPKVQKQITIENAMRLMADASANRAAAAQ